MSVNDDLYSQSETRKIIAQRDKIRIDLWPEQETEQPLWCPVCRVKLQFQENGAILYCRECGKKTPNHEIKREKRLKSRFPKSTRDAPLVISLPKKARPDRFRAFDSVNSNLSEEDIKDLRSMGYNI